VCCSVLQCASVSCIVLQGVAVLPCKEIQVDRTRFRSKLDSVCKVSIIRMSLYVCHDSFVGVT